MAFRFAAAIGFIVFYWVFDLTIPHIQSVDIRLKLRHKGMMWITFQADDYLTKIAMIYMKLDSYIFQDMHLYID